MWQENERSGASLVDLVAPVEGDVAFEHSGALESCAALWAVLKWVTGHREVFWTPTPKTKKADEIMKDWNLTDVTRPPESDPVRLESRRPL